MPDYLRSSINRGAKVQVRYWWLSLGLKDDLVYAPVSGLWNGSAAPVWICRVRGRWDTGRPFLWQGQKQLCGHDHGCKLFCSSLLFQWCTCYACEHMPVEADLGFFVQFRRLDATPLQAALQCVHSAFVASLIFFVLVIVHQRTAALVCAHHPSRWCGQPRKAGLSAASLWWRLIWLSPGLWDWWFCPAIGYQG